MADVNLTESDSIAVTVSATDLNGADSLTFYLIDAPNFISIASQDAGEATLIIDPSFSDAGNYQVVVGVSDQVGAQDETSFTVTVTDVQTSYTVLINFGDNSNTPPEWNNTAKDPFQGDILENLTPV